MNYSQDSAPLELIGLTEKELDLFFISIGEKPYRSKQVMQWIYQRHVENPDLMNNISKELRNILKEKTTIRIPEPVKIQKSLIDDTKKLLIKFADNSDVEAVIMKEGNRTTACLSTQVGCELGCRMCRTASMGFRRNLEPGEIIGQFLACENNSDSRISNVVFMGMGEPLLNLDNVLKAITILNSDFGPCIGLRKITISTAGIIPGLQQLAQVNLPTGIAVSLNSAIQEKRSKLMPVSRKYPLDKLKEALLVFSSHHSGRIRITIEYVLIKDFNDSEKDAQALVKFVHGIPCKINLISFNPFNSCDLSQCSSQTIEEFQNYLLTRCPAVTIRKSKGSDISAACGQLAVLP